jgi:hypothetical protein
MHPRSELWHPSERAHLWDVRTMFLPYFVLTRLSYWRHAFSLTPLTQHITHKHWKQLISFGIAQTDWACPQGYLTIVALLKKANLFGVHPFSIIASGLTLAAILFLSFQQVRALDMHLARILWYKVCEPEWQQSTCSTNRIRKSYLLADDYRIYIWKHGSHRLWSYWKNYIRKEKHKPVWIRHYSLTMPQPYRLC